MFQQLDLQRHCSQMFNQQIYVPYSVMSFGNILKQKKSNFEYELINKQQFKRQKKDQSKKDNTNTSLLQILKAYQKNPQKIYILSLKAEFSPQNAKYNKKSLTQIVTSNQIISDKTIEIQSKQFSFFDSSIITKVSGSPFIKIQHYKQQKKQQNELLLKLQSKVSQLQLEQQKESNKNENNQKLIEKAQNPQKNQLKMYSNQKQIQKINQQNLQYTRFAKGLQFSKKLRKKNLMKKHKHLNQIQFNSFLI